MYSGTLLAARTAALRAGRRAQHALRLPRRFQARLLLAPRLPGPGTAEKGSCGARGTHIHGTVEARRYYGTAEARATMENAKGAQPPRVWPGPRAARGSKPWRAAGSACAARPCAAGSAPARRARSRAAGAASEKGVRCRVVFSKPIIPY